MKGIGSRMMRAGTTAWAVAMLCAVLLAGCATASGSPDPNAPASGAAFNPPEHVIMPEISPDAADMDVSHVADGYVVVHESSAARLKFQVVKDDLVYNYDLPNDDTPTVFPVNMGDGAYRFRVMKNTEDNNYVEIGSVETDVTLNSEFAPFLIPTQYCSYDDGSACVAKAREITAGVANQGEAVKAICEYVVSHVSYDTDKAKVLSTATGYVPNPDDTLATGSGVCFDYASLGAAMLRSQGFPTKIITGYVSPGDLYHAWIMVYVDGSWQTGEFAVSPDEWSRVDLTFAASGSSEFTGDGASYTERYVY